MSIGNIHNNTRHAHRNGVILLGFHAIPKGECALINASCLLKNVLSAEHQDANSTHFWKFCHQLFHTTLSRILTPLKPAMTTPEVVKCSDGHFRCVIYGIGPYIADYPEQCLLACTVQDWCLQCVLLMPFFLVLISLHLRCLAPHTDLDCQRYPWCFRHHTTVLPEELQLGELWDEYGLVGDVVVSRIVP